MAIYQMKMRVVIEIFYKSCKSGNCALDQIILCSDEHFGPCTSW